jgi:hypothetical protein
MLDFTKRNASQAQTLHAEHALSLVSLQLSPLRVLPPSPIPPVEKHFISRPLPISPNPQTLPWTSRVTRQIAPLLLTRGPSRYAWSVNSAFTIVRKPLSQPQISLENFARDTARPEATTSQSFRVVHHNHPEPLADWLLLHTHPPDSTTLQSLISRERLYLPRNCPL